MTSPTKNPVPSGNILDQIFNAEKIDEAVNSDLDQYTDRLGIKRFTLTGIYNYVKNFLSGLTGTAGASNVGTSSGDTVQTFLDAPYVITGRANIRNPAWGAPKIYGADLDAATANAAAINRMLASSSSTFELDDMTRYINSTLMISKPTDLIGPGRSKLCLVWSGGDFPIIAQSNYATPAANGISNIRLSNLRITDLATSRTNNWSIDLTNGNSCGLDECQLDGVSSGGVKSDLYGVALGTKKGSGNTNSSFVVHLRKTRLAAAKACINTTDWYVTDCELWGNNRDHALMIGGGGTISPGNQIVPGETSGVFLFNEAGYDLDTLKIIGVYFDGSYVNVNTGWGILSDTNIGIVGSEIIGCNFWHINKGGINIVRAWNSTIQSNFRDCDADDTGEDDIVITDVTGCYIYNRHFRTVAPKTSLARVNLGRPYTLTGHQGFPISSVGGQVGYSASYNNGLVNNRECFEQLGGSNQTRLKYLTAPGAGVFEGSFINLNGTPNFSTGTRWINMSRDLVPLTTATDLTSLATSSQDYYISNIALHTGIPTGMTGTGILSARLVSDGTNNFAVLRLFNMTTNVRYFRWLNGGSWGAWTQE
ncbi:hypothetical protein [Klebsiella phage YC1]|nr:hypothetical protein [Klebsiella phage YC1]